MKANATSDFRGGSEFSDALLGWYRERKRDLPWRRRQDDAYAVWISEIMLQQTTVSAVIGFYERWMKRFPNVRTLADASLDEVLRYWAGLGYYSRARNIKKAAEIIAGRHGCALPPDVETLLTLPGIGRYTAGAISSIAYNKNAPILDANVVRVLSRLAEIGGAPKSGKTQAELWRLAEEIIPEGDARDFNQAMMELGALICSPKAPKCAACPVATWCEAHRDGIEERYPELGPPKAWKSARHAAVAVTRGKRLLLVKRPEGEVWAGLWELPRVIATANELLEDAARRGALETVGLDVAVGPIFGSVKHAIMDTRIALTGYTAASSDANPAVPRACAEIAWLDEEDIDTIALSSPQRKLLGLWRASLAQPGFGF